ncbi:MAG: hypothetical protein WCK39_04900 [Methanomassiliicoccales archaeon]
MLFSISLQEVSLANLASKRSVILWAPIDTDPEALTWSGTRRNWPFLIMPPPDSEVQLSSKSYCRCRSRTLSVWFFCPMLKKSS